MSLTDRLHRRGGRRGTSPQYPPRARMRARMEGHTLRSTLVVPRVTLNAHNQQSQHRRAAQPERRTDAAMDRGLEPRHR